MKSLSGRPTIYNYVQKVMLIRCSVLSWKKDKQLVIQPKNKQTHSDFVYNISIDIDLEV